MVSEVSQARHIADRVPKEPGAGRGEANGKSGRFEVQPGANLTARAACKCGDRRKRGLMLV